MYQQLPDSLYVTILTVISRGIGGARDVNTMILLQMGKIPYTISLKTHVNHHLSNLTINPNWESLY